MKFAYHYRKPFARQLALCEAFQKGSARAGHDVIAIEGFSGVENVDGLILFGIGGVSRDVLDSYINAGKTAVFLDKGYTTRASMYRVAVNAFQPVQFVTHARKPPDRWQALGISLPPYRVKHNGYILLDGASNKFCLFQRLGDWQAWGADTAAKIASHTTTPVKYRPRPSNNIRETLAPFADDMAGARLVASYGGNIGFDAVVSGVPHFAIGDSVARPMSQTNWRLIDNLHIPSEAERLQWLSNVAYCQWSLDEIARGDIWTHIGEQL